MVTTTTLSRRSRSGLSVSLLSVDLHEERTTTLDRHSRATRPLIQRRIIDDYLSRTEAACVRGWSGSEKRSEEHTSELQSRPHLVCRLLLEKKNQYKNYNNRS